jgi:hypothetical protein
MPELIPGVEFDFGGGRVRTIPPLSLGALQRLQGALSNLSTANAMDPATLDTVVKAAHGALRRNYPQVTEEEVGELVDVGNMIDVISCVLDVAGLKRKAAQDAKNQTAQSTQAPAALLAETPGPTGQP